MKGLRLFFFIFIFNLIVSAAFSDVTIVKVNKPESENDMRQDYYKNLLILALEKTKVKYGEYRIEEVDAGVQGRRIVMLAEGNPKLDITWTMTSIEREKLMLPVRIPLLKSLMGYRIFIINKEDKKKFAQIKTIDDLKKLTALQGHDWPDTDILIANGFKVQKSSNYEGMFAMMEAGRADYFPRGLNEPFEELKNRKELNLMVEETILIKYFAPFFFFVNVKKPQIRDRVEEGLKIAVADGSFDKLFYGDPLNVEMLKKANIEKRRIFEIDNPFLTSETKALMNKKEYLFQH